jgi:predicted Na+-dependent transporter
LGQNQRVSTGWLLLTLAGVVVVPWSLARVLDRFGSRFAGPVGAATPIIARLWAGVVLVVGVVRMLEQPAAWRIGVAVLLAVVAAWSFLTGLAIAWLAIRIVTGRAEAPAREPHL